ncbi:WecB/TagA/CpsF family glycosyltransferase [Frigoriglobus tundricola]|uniref:GT26 family glycosyltransferase n=1 Tax=Frigoriglobus tundricola TaxID=2774151 RepID=A0A6M5YZC7_9BACT|nr:WecB/TagA/CpsF family glycosyltransferase [Frigoriglobus tundricola]QJW99218.1 GT26 family glycosyltransferase [Frigoriglobus tundricola]
MSVPDSSPSLAPVVVWGVPFAPFTLAQALDEVERLIAAGRPRFFMTVNLHTAMLTAQDPAIRAAVDAAAFIVADGMPVVWASRLQPRRLPERVTGADMFPALCERAAKQGYRVYFLGGPPGVGEEAARNLTSRYPGLQVVGVESPPYRAATPQEEAELLDRIRAVRPQLLFVAFGQPKGEYWVHKNCPALDGTICAQVGAALDFAAGRINRAPRWMQKTGLEWVYRLWKEPRRLFSRYAQNAAFVVRMVIQDFKNRPRRHSRPAR